MRAWGRDKSGKWVMIDGEIDHSNFYITTLAQRCRLILGESPFFGNEGIPSQQSVITQIYPDYHINMIQQRFSNYFSSLKLTKISGALQPTYQFDIVTLSGQSVIGNFTT